MLLWWSVGNLDKFDNLVKEGTIKFYVFYVYDTWLLVKRQEIEKVLKAFNRFEKNLKFTADKFKNETTHFLDLEICPNCLKFFQKNTNTRQYISMNSFTLQKCKRAWIQSHVDQAKKMCWQENLTKALQSIKKFASWNGYPKNIVNAIIKRVLPNKTSTNDVISNEENNKVSTIFINTDYPRKKSEHLLKKYF